MNIDSETVKVDFVENVGDTLEMSIDYENPDKTQIDLSGYTVVVTIESNDNSTPFPITLTEGSGVTVGGSPYNIIALVTKAQTTSMGKGSFSHKWELTNDVDGAKNTIIKGVVKLNG